MNTDLDMMHSEGTIGLVPSSDGSDPVYRPFSPSVNFDDLFTISMPRFGSPSLPQTHTVGFDDDFLWGLPSSSNILNRPLDFPPFLLETSIGSPIEEDIIPGDENQKLILGRAISVPGVQSQLEGARSFITSLVQHGKVTQCHGTGPSAELEMPDVEDIMESLESLLPETGASSREFSDHTLSIQHASSSSNLFRTLIYSFTNNFAGLREVPRKALMKLLREHHDIRTQLFEGIKIGRPGVAKPLADNLFRAAVEGCDADAAATIIHHTRSNPKVAIDPNEIVCNFEDKDYTPIELAAKFRNTELVRTLVASRADPNKTYRQSEHDKYWEKGALALALRHWVNGSDYPFKPSPAGEPEPVNLDLLRLLLDCGAEVCMDLVENAMRPGPGHTAIAEELVSRIPARDHQTCFKSKWLFVSMIHYLENGAANRCIRRIFSDCDSTKCGKCKSENPKLVEMMLCHAARRSNVELSKFLVQYTTQLQSALAAAVRAASDELVQFLLDKGAHVDDPVEPWHPPEKCSDPYDYVYKGMYDENGYDRHLHVTPPEYVITPMRTPLAEAIRAGNDHLITTFERLGGLTRLSDEHHFHAAVLAATEVGNTSYLKFILDHGCSPPDGAGLTLALVVAIRNDETNAALILLDAGANPYSYRRMYGNPLASALSRFNKRVVESMLDCDVYYRGYNYIIHEKCALEIAGSWCGVDVIKDLIRFGADINHGVETTALGAAVRSRNRTLVHQLLDLGAKPRGFLRDPDGATPLRAALEIGDYDMARFLISKGADLADRSAFAYAMSHDTAGYELLLSEFKSYYPQGLPGFGGPLFSKAIELDSQSLVDSLLGSGADVNSWCSRQMIRLMDESGPMNNQRVLGFAIKHKRGRCYELVRKLLNRGAKPDHIVSEREMPSEHGIICVMETPLLLAIKTKNLTMVSLLLEYGAGLNRPARRGVHRTPLQAACETGSYTIVEFLLRRGANVNSAAAERDGGTALQMAAKTGSLRIVKLLLDNGADPHMAKSKLGGRTAFEAAAEYGCIEILCSLWNAVLPFGFSEKECQSAKDFAKQKGHRGCIDFIDFLSGESPQSFLN